MSKKVDELRGQDVGELESRLVDLQTELAKERSLATRGTKSEKPSKIRNLRRDIARILTLVNEKNRVENKKIKFNDLIRGEVEFDVSLLGDVVVAKDLETPLYHFAVVIDDFLMQISHVIRGEEHLSNTPRQILLQQALGFDTPEYAHLPLMLNTDRSKMSKRQGGAALS